ncbi:MAG: ATP-binding protein [Myxococcota bacterium]
MSHHDDDGPPPPAASHYEKLGAFYLGQRTEPGHAGAPVLYDARDLTTHGLCVGMTGSGKTGLCLALLEEAAIDGVGAICLDPKGDLTNLLLTFPELRPEDFAPWIDPAEATRHGRTTEDHAATVAADWRAGLRASGQDGGRIRRLQETTDIALFTPGRASGRPLSLLGDLVPRREEGAAVPPSPADVEERIDGVVAGLLSLVGLEDDPIQSREHILLSLVLADAATKGTPPDRGGLDLGGLVRAVIEPPFDRVGVLECDAFFPARDRQKLALSLNHLLASPAFSAWRQGEPLDVDRLLRAPDGRPRVSILSLAHLSDRERMFFVATLLGAVRTWMRRQPGTSSLRALLYMDEVFGFFPPVAEPPSKRIMLSLLKQARAFGLGILLATQNPVDLDYKGLSNCGTWMLGRLQTQRDLDRVLDGLAGVGGGGFDRAAVAAEIAGLERRHFYLHNVHEPEPVRFRTRWVLSYLRGPLTRDQTDALCRRSDASPAATGANEAPSVPPAAPQPQRPVVGADVEELFLAPSTEGATRTTELVYAPHLLATVTLHYTHRYAELDQWLTPTLIVPFPPTKRARVDWKRATWRRGESLRLSPEPTPGVTSFARLGPLDDDRLDALRRDLKQHLYRHETMPVFYCRPLRLWSRYGESAEQMGARVSLVLREQRDRDVAKLRARYAPRIQRLDERLRVARQKADQQRAERRQAGFGTAFEVGATVMSAFFGRKRYLTGARQIARGAARTRREQGDVARADDNVAAIQQARADLERELEEETAHLAAAATLEAPLDQKPVKPTKGDIAIERFALLWRPTTPSWSQPS